MITIDPRSTDRVFGFQVSGKLTRDDYRRMVPRLEEAIKKHGKISVLVQIESLTGMEPGAMWEELKFDLKHFRHFDRLALVGDGKKWYERSMSFASHLTPAEGRYFPTAELDDAWEWVAGGEPAADRRFRSVLLATDFSKNAATASRWAALIAKTHEVPVAVLHVPPVITTTSLPLDIQGKLEARLDELVASIREQGVDASGRWEMGKPWEVIAEESGRHDLVVIGARGHTPIVHLALGSTADRVLRSAGVPVLTIHQDDASPHGMPRNVLVPTDFSRSASLALDAVARVFGSAADGGLDITLLHAWQPLVDYPEVYAPVPAPTPFAQTEDQARELLETVAERVRSESVRVNAVLRAGYAARVIEEEAEAIRPDLVAMGTHGHSGLARYLLGSVAERVVHRAPCPVLTVGLSAAEARAAEPAAEPAQAVG